MVAGNVTSYARVLNGPQQLDKIRTYNDLAATMAVLKKEKEQMREETNARKKKLEEQKATRKAEKEREAISKANEMAPVCKAHVDQGLDHVLKLKVPEQRDILRYHFRMSSVDIDRVSKAIYKLNLTETIALKRLMPPMPQLSQLPQAELTGQIPSDYI